MAFSKDDVIWELESRLKDLERQVEEKWRWRYYGEAKAVIRTLALIGWLDDGERDQWYCRCKASFEKSLRNEGAEDSGEKPSQNWHLCPVTRQVCS